MSCRTRCSARRAQGERRRRVGVAALGLLKRRAGEGCEGAGAWIEADEREVRVGAGGGAADDEDVCRALCCRPDQVAIVEVREQQNRRERLEDPQEDLVRLAAAQTAQRGLRGGGGGGGGGGGRGGRAAGALCLRRVRTRMLGRLRFRQSGELLGKVFATGSGGPA